MHSFSVTCANVAISINISLKTRCFWLQFCLRKYRCTFNHFYVMDPESY